jgi:V/A-type H+-transporting ATPase subunit E
MGLEKVIEEILAAGEEQRKRILAEATEEKKRMVAAAKVEADNQRKLREKQFQERCEMNRQQAISSAELEAKKRILQEQNAILAETKSELLKSLSSLDATQRKRILEKLMTAASKKLPKGIVHCRKEDEGLFSAPAGFKKIADLNGVGGMLVESEDGAYRIDLTFEVLLDDVWTKNVRRIYELVFGGA